MVKVQIMDGKGNGAPCHTHRDGDDTGVIAFTEPLRTWTNNSQFATNTEYGLNLNVDAAFGGTPEVVHNGIDTVAWTASSITGGKFTFNSTDRFYEGAQSIKTDNAAVGDTMQIDRGSLIDLSGFVALTMWINVDKDWAIGDSVSIYGWDITAGTIQGTKVFLEDYFNELDFDVWHKISIPLGDMTLGENTIINAIDSFRIEIETKSGKSPLFYIDTFQIEESGEPARFRIDPPLGTKMRVSSLDFSFVDDYDATLLNSSMPNLSYDKILGLPKLQNGILLARIIDGKTLFSASVTCLYEFLRISGTIISSYSDGVNTGITIRIVFDSPIVLESTSEDYISIQIADDLSNLTGFTVFANGSTRLL